MTDILAVVAALHKKQACTRQIGCDGQVNAADTVRAPERFKVKGRFVVYVVKGQPRRFHGFPDVEFFAEYPRQFIAVVLCPFNLRVQIM